LFKTSIKSLKAHLFFSSAVETRGLLCDVNSREVEEESFQDEKMLTEDKSTDLVQQEPQPESLYFFQMSTIIIIIITRTRQFLIYKTH